MVLGRELGRDVGLRGESEGAAVVHLSGEVTHLRVTLEMEIAKDDIALPATEQLNDREVNAGAEESHGAAGAKAAGRYFIGVEAQAVAWGGGSQAKCGRQEGGRDLAGTGGSAVAGVERGVGRCVVCAKVAHSRGDGGDGAAVGGAGATVHNFLAPNTILLVSKDKKNGRRKRKELNWDSGRQIQGPSDEELNIAEAEGRAEGDAA